MLDPRHEGKHAIQRSPLVVFGGVSTQVPGESQVFKPKYGLQFLTGDNEPRNYCSFGTEGTLCICTRNVY